MMRLILDRMTNLSLGFCNLRDFAARFCVVFALLSSPLALASNPSAPASLPAPLPEHDSAAFLAALRLQGVSAIGADETAYFTDTRTGDVIALRVGSSLRGEFTLRGIENALDHLTCQAVFLSKSKEVRIGIADFMQSARSEPAPALDQEQDDEAASEPVVRVAVRPWVDPTTES